jgi:hypothetical protein
MIPTPKKCFRLWKRKYLLEKYNEQEELVSVKSHSTANNAVNEHTNGNMTALNTSNKISHKVSQQVIIEKKEISSVSGNNNVDTSKRPASASHTNAQSTKNQSPGQGDIAPVMSAPTQAPQHNPLHKASTISLESFRDMLSKIDARKDADGCMELIGNLNSDNNIGMKNLCNVCVLIVGLHLQNNSTGIHNLHVDNVNIENKIQQLNILIEKNRVDLNHQVCLYIYIYV